MTHLMTRKAMMTRMDILTSQFQLIDSLGGIDDIWLLCCKTSQALACLDLGMGQMELLIGLSWFSYSSRTFREWLTTCKIRRIITVRADYALLCSPVFRELWPESCPESSLLVRDFCLGFWSVKASLIKRSETTEK